LRDPGAITDSFAGSGFIVLESLAHALERKTKIYAQIEGVTVITAAYIAAKHYDVSVLNELACRSKIELGEHDVLLYMSYEEEDCLRRKDLFLQPFKGVKFDCSSSFEYDFSAGEAFQIILGILGVYCLYPLSIFKTLTAIEEPINRLFVMRTALAGANACALFSRYSLSKD
jgi:hypothetical protein